MSISLLHALYRVQGNCGNHNRGDHRIRLSRQAAVHARQNIATVIHTAYDFISPEQSEVAGGELNAGGDAVTNAASASASQVGCTDCSLPDASDGCADCNEDAN